MTGGNGRGPHERTTCPRRSAAGPWKREPGLDRWETSRWTTDHEAAEAEREAFREENPDGSISEVAHEWVWDGEPPRTCSFCGGVHPADAVRLVELGWGVEPTDKSYKRYLKPPGRREAERASLDRMRGGEDPAEAVGGLPPAPVPPVKLYTWHFDEAWAERFNSTLREQREGGDPDGEEET